MLRINLFFVILCVSLNAGCSLKKPVTCIKGQTECSGGMYRTCDEAADEWVNYECSSECNTDGTCIHRECNEEDPPICNTETSELRVKKQCVNGTWQISLCYNTKNCEDPCIKFEQSESSICTSDDNSCIDLSNGESVLLACENNKYKLDKCPDNSGCSKDGKSCVPDKAPAVSECKEGNTCMTSCNEDGYARISIDDQTISAYCIDSLEKLKAMRDAINQGKQYPDKYNTDGAFILMNDITITDSNWEPIGKESKPFKYNFFGNNKKITFNKVYIGDNEANLEKEKNFGLFGVVEGKVAAAPSIIQDLKLNAKFILLRPNGQNIGMLAGFTDNAIIRNIEYSGSISYNTYEEQTYDNLNNTGGLIGLAIDNTTITNIHTPSECQNCLTINALNSNAGGMIGKTHTNRQANHIKISDCSININLTNSRQIVDNEQKTPTGGLIGASDHCAPIFKENNINNNCDTCDKKYCDICDTKHCTTNFKPNNPNSFHTLYLTSTIVTGTITSDSSYIGGIVGNAIRLNVYDAHTDVLLSSKEAHSYYGGIIGYADKCIINNSSSMGSISLNTKSAYIGGIVGFMTGDGLSSNIPIIKNSFSTMNLTKTSLCSGIASMVQYHSRIENSYYIGNSDCSIIGHSYKANLNEDKLVNNSYYFGPKTNNLIVNTLSSSGIIFSDTYVFSKAADDDTKYVNQPDLLNVEASSYGRFSVFETTPPTIIHRLPELSDSESDKLIDHLGDSYTLAKCKYDIDGQGEKNYILPVIKCNKPSFCNYLDTTLQCP